jgi:hypothetical protein
MSHVTDVVLCAPDDEVDGPASAAAVETLNRWLASRGHGQLDLVAHADTFGGEKVAGISVWGGAFKHLDMEGFHDAVISAPWAELARVAVMLWTPDLRSPLCWSVPEPQGVQPSPFARPASTLPAAPAQAALPSGSCDSAS